MTFKSKNEPQLLIQLFRRSYLPILHRSQNDNMQKNATLMNQIPNIPTYPLYHTHHWLLAPCFNSVLFPPLAFNKRCKTLSRMMRPVGQNHMCIQCSNKNSAYAEMSCVYLCLGCGTVIAEADLLCWHKLHAPFSVSDPDQKCARIGKQK